MINILLVMAMSIDTFFACVSYGLKNISIPFRSRFVLAATGAVFLTLSMLFGHAIKLLLPGNTVKIIGFTVLLFMGCINIFEPYIKKFFRKCVKFHLPFFDLVVEVYLDQTQADADNSHVLSPREAVALAIPLSIDSLVTGLGITPGALPALAALPALSLFCGLIAAQCGFFFGRRRVLAGPDGSFSNLISGAILIAIAFLKLL